MLDMSPTFERAVVFGCEGDRLIGIVTVPSDVRSDLGVLVIVGGPQYRVGSHRQFVHLTRSLAEDGWPAFRFDYRGMGDAEGTVRPFDTIDADIRAAIDAFIAAQPSVRRIVLWGLCDGASAALMYAGTDVRVAGLAIANPWVRSTQTEAVARVKHYYRGRLLSAAFWTKLLGGGVDLRAAIRDSIATVVRALRRTGESTVVSFQSRMLAGLQRHDRPVLLLTSGNDLTAKEFLEHAAQIQQWRQWLESRQCSRHDLPEADHTFSTLPWKGLVAEGTGAWLCKLGDGEPDTIHGG